MKTPHQIALLLSTIVEYRAITERSEALFLARYNAQNPGLVRLTYPEDVTTIGPYFTAELTKKGRQQLERMTKDHALFRTLEGAPEF